MLICIDAGHYLGTPGKRCLKSIDPGETREWTLNARIADKLQDRLKPYRCETMRVDDITGAREITLSQRVAAANSAGADLYLSIHHNAGVMGGSGGGIVVFTAPGASKQSRVVQKAVYEHTVAATGLRGNRANPTPEAGYYVLKHTRMPAVLGEFGFMDSATDTPIILTEEYADQVAEGIAAALAEVYKLEEVEILEEQRIRAIVREELAEVEAQRAKLPASSWAKPLIEEAKALKITDSGERPRSSPTREECIAMSLAAYRAARQ